MLMAGSVRTNQDVVMETASTSEASGSSGASVTLFYRTGWNKAYLHGSVKGGEWKDFELQKARDLP